MVQFLKYEPNFLLMSFYTWRSVTVKPTAETGGFMRWQRAAELLSELADVFCGQVLFCVFTAIALLLLLLYLSPSLSWKTIEFLSRTLEVSLICVFTCTYSAHAGNRCVSTQSEV